MSAGACEGEQGGWEASVPVNLEIVEIVSLFMLVLVTELVFSERAGHVLND